MTVAAPPPETKPYQPYGAALDLFYDKSEEVLIEGPAGTGKTRAVLEKIHLCLLKYSGARGLIVRKTRTSMTESVLVTFEEDVLPVNSPIKDGPGRMNRREYEYPNDSRLVVGGLDKADRIMSTQYDIIAIFEATEATEDDLEKLTTRLRNGVIPYQQLICDCNPGPSWHWLNQRAMAGRMGRLLSRHEDNPTVTDKYLEKLRALTGARKSRLYEGIWATQEGLVYDDFDPDIHVIDAMPEGWERWTKYRVVDFGYTNPFVNQWWAEDGDGRLYLYREWYKTKMLVEDHAKVILRHSRSDLGDPRDDEDERPARFAATVADHDAEDRATMARHGIRTVPAHKAISEGIQAVQERLRVHQDGRPRIYFLRDATVERDKTLLADKKPASTLEEIEGYIWAESKEDKPEKEEPVDLHNHGMDCMRYMVAHVDNLGVSKQARLIA